MKRCSLLVVLLLGVAGASRPLQGRDVSLLVDFAPAAVAASNQANELAKKVRDAKVREDAQERLALYQQHRPFHLAPPQTSAR